MTDGPALDFRPHGCVTVRVHGASEPVARSLARHLGSFLPGGTERPDVVLTRGRRWSLRAVELGEPVEIVAPLRSPQSVPVVKAGIALAALARGVLPVHGTAFAHGPGASVVTGGRRSGKTAVLLAALGGGARYLASEWVVVDTLGRLVPVSEPIRVRHCYLAQTPRVSRIPMRSRLRLAALRGERRYVDLAPPRVATVIPDGSFTQLDRLIVAEPGAAKATLERIDGTALIDDLIEWLWRDLSQLPVGHLRETVQGLHRELLVDRLAGVAVFRLPMPYPSDIRALTELLARSLSHDFVPTGGRACSRSH